MEIRHYKFDRITLDPEKCSGKPCIRGLRMPVASILSYLSSGMTVDEILKEWSELEREDITEVGTQYGIPVREQNSLDRASPERGRRFSDF